MIGVPAFWSWWRPAACFQTHSPLLQSLRTLLWSWGWWICWDCHLQHIQKTTHVNRWDSVCHQRAVQLTQCVISSVILLMHKHRLTLVPVPERGHDEEADRLIGSLFEDGRCEALIRPSDSWETHTEHHLLQTRKTHIIHIPSHALFNTIEFQLKFTSRDLIKKNLHLDIFLYINSHTIFC